jgi:hypothetical protein
MAMTVTTRPRKKIEVNNNIEKTRVKILLDITNKNKHSIKNSYNKADKLKVIKLKRQKII